MMLRWIMYRKLGMEDCMNLKHINFFHYNQCAIDVLGMKTYHWLVDM